MKLTKNQKYSATIRLGFLEKYAGNDTIKQKLVDAGFTDVLVTGGGSKRNAIGVWSGSDTDAPLPSQISENEIIAV